MHIRIFLLFCLAPSALAQIDVANPIYYENIHKRFDDYLFRTYTDPARFAGLLVDSAEEHWFKDPHQWDNSAESYTYRVASGWGRRIVRNTAQLGFETILREDSRYRPSGSKEFRKRVVFAISHSVLAYRPDGSVEPAYGRVAAGIVAAASSSTWHPQSISAGSLLGGAGMAAIDRAGGNLLTEFEPDLRTMGRRTWSRFRTR